MEASINQPHANEAPDAAFDDFFGGEPAVEPEAEQPVAQPDGDPGPAEPAPELSNSESSEQEEAPVEAPVIEDAPEPEPQPAAPEPAPEPEPQPEGQKAKGGEPRSYLVFQEVELTGPMLQSLLTEFKESSDPSPRKAYMLLATVEQRTAIGALEEVYTAHQEALGEEATLVPLTDKQWKPKHIKPQVRTKVSLDIS